MTFQAFLPKRLVCSLIHRCHAQLWVGRRGPFQLEHSTTPEDSRRLIRVLKCSPTIYLFICTRPTSYFHERGHIRSLMPRSHQKFLSPPAVKLLGIMFRNRCWSILFTLLQVEMPTNGVMNFSYITVNFSVRFQPWNCWELCTETNVGPPLFTL